MRARCDNRAGKHERVLSQRCINVRPPEEAPALGTVWVVRVIDREKADMARVKVEVTRYNRQADDYEAKIASFQEQLEPLSQHAADFHSMLADIESRFLTP